MAKRRLIDRIKDDLQKEGLAARSKKARDWLISKVRQARLPGAAREGFVNLSKNSLSPMEFSKKIVNGSVKIYFFIYNPKTKEKLPYYDKFPLVIPIGSYNDGFLGLNIHYIKPNHRLYLLDRLYTVLTNDLFDETTKIKVGYKIIKENSLYFTYARPCIKRYLYSGHVKSNFLELSADEWEIAALLPFENFEKASTSTVWKISASKYYR